MKLLTLLCFDIMAFVWACLDLFYHYAVKGARTLGRWAWTISFILSLFASVFYLIISSMFRFRLEVTSTQVNIGYGITICALVLQIVFITFWWYLEWNARHPYQDEYWEEGKEYQERAKELREPVAVAQTEVIEEPAVTSQKKKVKRVADTQMQK